MKDILKLARIQVLLIPIFIFFKLIRPATLKSSAPEFFKIILLSLPNFFEAITGMLLLTGLGLIFNDRLNKKHPIKSKNIYKLAVVPAGIFVIMQELNLLNLGKNNTVDNNDLIFSVIGLLIGYWIVLWIQPRIYPEA